MKNENPIQIILEALYRIPDYLSIQKNILEPLNIKADTAQIMLIRKRLSLQELIIEKEPDSPTLLIKITPKGYQAIEILGTYEAYCQEQERTALSQREVQYLKEKNIRLKKLTL